MDISGSWLCQKLPEISSSLLGSCINSSIFHPIITNRFNNLLIRKFSDSSGEEFMSIDSKLLTDSNSPPTNSSTMISLVVSLNSPTLTGPLETNQVRMDLVKDMDNNFSSFSILHLGPSNGQAVCEHFLLSSEGLRIVLISIGLTGEKEHCIFDYIRTPFPDNIPLPLDNFVQIQSFKKSKLTTGWKLLQSLDNLPYTSSHWTELVIENLNVKLEAISLGSSGGSIENIDNQNQLEVSIDEEFQNKIIWTHDRPLATLQQIFKASPDGIPSTILWYKFRIELGPISWYIITNFTRVILLNNLVRNLSNTGDSIDIIFKPFVFKPIWKTYLELHRHIQLIEGILKNYSSNKDYLNQFISEAIFSFFKIHIYLNEDSFDVIKDLVESSSTEYDPNDPARERISFSLKDYMIRPKPNTENIKSSTPNFISGAHIANLSQSEAIHVNPLRTFRSSKLNKVNTISTPTFITEKCENPISPINSTNLFSKNDSVEYNNIYSKNENSTSSNSNQQPHLMVTPTPQSQYTFQPPSPNIPSQLNTSLNVSDIERRQQNFLNNRTISARRANLTPSASTSKMLAKKSTQQLMIDTNMEDKFADSFYSSNEDSNNASLRSSFDYNEPVVELCDNNLNIDDLIQFDPSKIKNQTHNIDDTVNQLNGLKLDQNNPNPPNKISIDRPLLNNSPIKSLSQPEAQSVTHSSSSSGDLTEEEIAMYLSQFAELDSKKTITSKNQGVERHNGTENTPIPTSSTSSSQSQALNAVSEFNDPISLGKILSKQEAEYGINMLTSLNSSDKEMINELISSGIVSTPNDAAFQIFETKCLTGLIKKVNSSRNNGSNSSLYTTDVCYAPDNIEPYAVASSINTSDNHSVSGSVNNFSSNASVSSNNNNNYLDRSNNSCYIGQNHYNMSSSSSVCSNNSTGPNGYTRFNPFMVLTPEESTQLMDLLNVQDKAFSVNMYSSYSPQDEGEYQQLINNGLNTQQAVYSIFERKYMKKYGAHAPNMSSNVSMNSSLNYNINNQPQFTSSSSNSSIISNSASSQNSLSRATSFQNMPYPPQSSGINRNPHFFPPSPPNSNKSFNFNNIPPISQSSNSTTSYHSNYAIGYQSSPQQPISGSNFSPSYLPYSPQTQQTYSNPPYQNQFAHPQNNLLSHNQNSPYGLSQYNNTSYVPPQNQYNQQQPYNQGSIGLSPISQSQQQQSFNPNQSQYINTQTPSTSSPAPPLAPTTNVGSPNSSSNSISEVPGLVRQKSKIHGLFNRKSINPKETPPPSSSSSNSTSSHAPLSKTTKFSSIKINESDISKLTQMGYSRDVAISSLAQCKGDIATAINTLVGNS